MSSPLRPGADVKEQLEWYKTQYAQLETDLADFQSSSKELEEQLEKDVETAEKNERKWKGQVEKLTFEVDEWKTKHKQAKTEANSAHNALEKEITTMRETNRTLMLKLRDTEVMNDDYERQARNTETSLEDLEGKYNAAIERGVLFEETIKQGEQEREELRIETQRLRDELSDLKVENEITLEKLRLAEHNIDDLRARKPSLLAVDSLRARSPASEASGMTPLSPTASTPPPRSDTASDVPTPPSPPLSDAPANRQAEQKTPVPTAKRRSFIPDASTPRPAALGLRTAPRHARGPSVASTLSASTAASDAKGMRPPTRPRVKPSNVPDRMPRSESLYQIRGLIGRMQKIEERVHNARSKLPAPGSTPRGSPRPGSALGDSIPSSVTVRRVSKRPSISRTSSAADGDPSSVDDGTSATGGAGRRGSHVKRLSYGIPRPTSQATSRSDLPERPPSALERPPSAAASRPSSRASTVSQSHRPPSRSGARTEQGHYGGAVASSGIGRPRSSLGGTYAGLSHGHKALENVTEQRRGEEASEGARPASSTARRSTLERSSLPQPAGSGLPLSLPKASSSGLRQPRTGARASNTFTQVREEEGDENAMKPPHRREASDLGETY